MLFLFVSYWISQVLSILMMHSGLIWWQMWKVQMRFSHARTWSLKRCFFVNLMVSNFSVAWKLKKLDIHINIHFNLLCHVILLCFASFSCPFAYRQLLCAIRPWNTGWFETSMYDCLQCLVKKIIQLLPLFEIKFRTTLYHIICKFYSNNDNF